MRHFGHSGGTLTVNPVTINVPTNPRTSSVLGFKGGIQSEQSENEDDVSMNEVPDVSPGSSHESEEFTAFRRTESTGPSERIDNNNQDNEGQNSLTIQATQEDLSGLEGQIYRDEDFDIEQTLTLTLILTPNPNPNPEP